MLIPRHYLLGPFALAATVPLFACAQVQPVAISSTLAPGSPIVTYLNSSDRFDRTVLSSDSRSTQAGVDGRTLTIAAERINLPVVLVTIDINGNMGLRGSYHTLSSRKAKKDISDFTRDPLSLLRRTKIVTFRYRGESEREPPHVGFIAEDTPVPLTDFRHESVDLNSSLAVTMAATRKLDERIAALQRNVDALRSQLRARHNGVSLDNVVAQ